MSSTVIAKHIWAEDLFKWFSAHILDAGGDGCGALVCGNPEETADRFLEWFQEKNGRPLNLDREKTVVEFGRIMVNFHDSNENFIFTDNSLIELHHHDYIFKVEEHCESMTGTWKIRAYA